MPFTEGRWESGSSFPDLQIFIGPDEIKNTSGAATLTLNAPGDLSLNIGNSQACVFVVTEASLFRSGVYANAGFDQSQFGTSAGVPGPSAVAGTSGPLGLKSGFPPLTGANLPTLGNLQYGPLSKGIQVTSITVLYSVTGLALSLAQVGITATKFANNVALVVSNILAKAANGLPTAIGAGASSPYFTTVNIPTPAFLTGGGNGMTIELDLTTGASGTARVYGILVNCAFNFN